MRMLCLLAIEFTGHGSGLAPAPYPRARVMRMSVQAISWVIEHSRHKGNSFVVLLMIANHARSDGTGAWPSVKTIAREARVSERTVQRTIKRLTRFTHDIPAELTVQEGRGPSGCNLYTIPGVKLSPGGRQIALQGVSDSVTQGVSQVSPELSFNRPNTSEKNLSLRAKRAELERQDRLARYGR